MQIQVRIDGLDRVRDQLSSLTGQQFNAAIATALNRTAAKGRTEVDRAVRERYNISASEVRNSVSIRPARNAPGRLEAEIQLFGSPSKRGRSLNVIRFLEKRVSLAEGRRRKKGGTENVLRFKFLRGGGLKTIDGAFIGNKGRTVFRRVGKGRLPIEPVQVIGISGMFGYRPISERVLRRISQEFNVEFNRAALVKLLRSR